MMARDENAVMYAVEQVCSLYGVQVTREQSRQFNVQGAAGRWRPMFFGTWTDTMGKLTRRVGKGGKRTNIWHKGKADFLARPRIKLDGISPLRISVPLWIECKSATGKQTADQMAFQCWVERNGDPYLILAEDVRPLIQWFESHGVERNCEDVELISVVSPLDASAMDDLPCRWCKLTRAQHRGPMLCCPMELAGCSTRLIGKVWSPDLRKGVQNGKAAGAGSSGTDTERD